MTVGTATLRAALLLACLHHASGCAYYSTSAGAVGGIRSIAVPVAENETAEFGVGEQLTEQLGDAFTRDGQLRVVDQESADAVVYLRLLSLADAPFTFTAAEVTEQYRFEVRVVASVIRTADGERLVELERLQGWGTYDAAMPDSEGREPAVERALGMVVDEIVNRTTAGW